MQPQFSVLERQIVHPQTGLEVKREAKGMLTPIQKIRRVVATVVPRNARLIVISKGDERLVQMPCESWHFPRAKNGSYAGYYPADSAEAIDSLEKQRGIGGRFLLIPDTAFWWLDHYKRLHDYLDTTYARIWNDKGCIIYHLEGWDSAERLATGQGIFIVSGMPGAGKTTVCRLLTRHIERAVHISSDRLRILLVSGGARVRHGLLSHQVCVLADSYYQAGFASIIDGFVTSESLKCFWDNIRGRPLFLVVLLPCKDVVQQRDAGRAYSNFQKWSDRDAVLRNASSRPGLWIDSSDQRPEETVAEILERVWSDGLITPDTLASA